MTREWSIERAIDASQRCILLHIPFDSSSVQITLFPIILTANDKTEQPKNVPTIKEALGMGIGINRISSLCITRRD